MPGFERCPSLSMMACLRTGRISPLGPSPGTGTWRHAPQCCLSFGRKVAASSRTTILITLVYPYFGISILVVLNHAARGPRDYASRL